MAQQTEHGPWQPPPARPRRRLYRRTDDKMIAGVASGLADYFDVDPVLVRIGFVLLAIAGGAGLLLYLAMWWIVPPITEVSNAGEDAIRRLKRAPAWVAFALLIIGGLLLANELGPRHGDLIWGAGLVAIGVLLFWQSGRGEPVPAGPAANAPAMPGPYPDAASGFSTASVATDPSPTTVPFASAPTATERPTAPLPPVAEPWQPGAVPPLAGFGEPPGRYESTARSQPPPRRRRERSGLGLATLGAAFLAVGVAALLDIWGVFHLSLVQYLSIGLVVLSIGLLVGAWVGRARWLIVPAVLLVPFVFMASLVTVPFTGGVGDRTLAPTTIRGGQATYRLVAGRMVLDLTNVDLTAAGSAVPARVTASVVAGSLEVVVPRSMPVHVDAEVGAGAMNILGIYDDGLQVHRTAGQSIERSQLRLNLAVSFGRIIVRRGFGVVPAGSGSTGVGAIPVPVPPAKPFAPAPPK